MTQQSYNPADYPPGLVAIPATDFIWTSCVTAFMQLMFALPPGSGMEIGRASQSPAANRNSLIEAFLKTDYSWIIFLDSDMLPPPAAVLRLLSHGLDLVGAQYFMRTPPFKPCFRKLPDTQIPHDCTEPCEVEFVGTGMLLVRRNIIESIPFPHFEHAIPGYGEDRLFCEKARQRGAKVFVDCGLSIGHLTTRAVTKEDAIAQFNSPEGRAMYQRPSHPQGWQAANDKARGEILERAATHDGNGVKV